MFCENALYGHADFLKEIRNISDTLNVKVAEQVNDNQNLMMINSFMRESNEYQFQKCLQDRISHVASWRWVLEDLSKRLEDAIDALKYERDAVSVVIKRIKDEISGVSRHASRPGALNPLNDNVEEAISQELFFLREEKKRFEKIVKKLDGQIGGLEKIKRKVENDAVNKCQAISIDEACTSSNYFIHPEGHLRTKKKSLPINRWERSCSILKRVGLNALTNAIITRQQVRAARAQLSVAAQAYGTRVDTALRRRLQSNLIKLQDLDWQRDEAIRDSKSLEDELSASEKSLLDSMDRIKLVEARLADRSLRPGGEHTRDNVNRQLRDELGKLRKFMKELRVNIENIINLQNNLTNAITHIDCCAEDITQVVNIDQIRINGRMGINTTESGVGTSESIPSHDLPSHSSRRRSDIPLSAIMEEDETN